MSTVPPTISEPHPPAGSDGLVDAVTQGRTDLPTDLPTADMAMGDVDTIQLIEESVRIDKRALETGRIRVNARTKTLDEVLREILRTDAVNVTRVPINRTIATGEIAPQVRVEAGVTIIPVLEEVLVVEKRLVLREEVHIRQTTSGEDVEVPVTVRRQHAVVERVGPDGQVVDITS